jgi:hypothetical protein
MIRRLGGPPEHELGRAEHLQSLRQLVGLAQKRDSDRRLPGSRLPFVTPGVIVSSLEMSSPILRSFTGSGEKEKAEGKEAAEPFAEGGHGKRIV